MQSSHLLMCDIPRSMECDTSGGKSFTGYVAHCIYGDHEWTIMKRYSQFYDLKSQMEKEMIIPSVPFPSKKFSTLSADAVEKRRVQLDCYMRELSNMMMMDHPKLVLREFLEVEAHTQAGSSGSARKTSASDTPEPAPEPAPVLVRQSWDQTWMDQDPLAAMMNQDGTNDQLTTSEEAPPSRSAQKPAATTNSNSEREHAATRQSPPTSKPLPSFLSHSQTKTFEPSGEGLRDAIKNGDVHGVQEVLRVDTTCAGYKDRQDQSMLHLAAIFNHTEIAELLLMAGADPTVENSDHETAMDVAAPTLKRKMQQHLAMRAAQTQK
uniref:PX domain-containing protein n=1 Tax=Octactis speculum TaxID=3111310 RepID=A0A7S2D169_9STRA|mmetsp:Transcript_41463/g.56529  ORF Transcript_41463/g.56529 Transcript_41463/m.56529 type:complete len:322 (+) Transcript_41463:47-1012(+)